MNIYFIENESPLRDSSGGVMSYIKGLSEYLRERGHKTVLLGGGNLKGIVTSFSDYIPVVMKTNPSNFRYFCSLFKIMATLNLKETDIIHVQRPDMLLPSIIFNRKNILISTLHGAHDIAVFDKKGFLLGKVYSILQSLAFRKADKLIAVDRGTRDYYKNKYRWLKDKISVISVGFDAEKFYPMNRNELREKYELDPHDNIIIFVGRIEKEKNLPFLINAFSRIKKYIENAKLIIVGQGREEHILKQKIKRMQIRNVIFMGEIENKKIPELLNCANVLTLCSNYEGSPTVIKEALACNLPVVSFDVGDAKEIIEAMNGGYIAVRDIDNFSNKIIKLLTENREKNTREKILQFSNKNMGRKTLDIYNSLQKQRSS